MRVETGSSEEETCELNPQMASRPELYLGYIGGGRMPSHHCINPALAPRCHQPFIKLQLDSLNKKRAKMLTNIQVFIQLLLILSWSFTTEVQSNLK